MNTVKCPHCNENINVADLPLGNPKFLVEGCVVEESEDLGVRKAFKYFGPFDSIKRAEEVVSKVCGGFESVDILEKNLKTNEVKSLTEKFLEK